LHHLETVPVEPDPHHLPFRFPVQYVIRPRTPEYPDYRGYAGQVAAGTITEGDEVLVLPAGLRSRVRRIDTMDGPLPEAGSGRSVHPAVGGRVGHLARRRDRGRDRRAHRHRRN